MNKKARAWLIIAVFLVVAGLGLFAAAMTANLWDFNRLSTVSYVTNQYEINGYYESIWIAADTADIVFVPSEDANSTVTCYEQENVRHGVELRNGTLVIEVTDARKWNEFFGISIGSPSITVMIPQNAYKSLSVQASTGDVKLPQGFQFESIEITASTGDISVEDITTGTLAFSVSTGSITACGVTCAGNAAIHVSTGRTVLTDFRCSNLVSDGNTGRMFLNNVIAGEGFSITRTTGDIKLDRCDAPEIFIQTGTGDVTGNLLSGKVFITQTDTGSINVPNTQAGGKCRISTTTGSIKITIH